ncbi:unnamed protein product [Adineta ricciae]|uniref:Uncharacterized protein n=1 Tax=Adineta ricciae TaxID=249248 RepID=A0A814LC21_ADIRI|nr:unnamed protein product [Adineta ricciae]
MELPSTPRIAYPLIYSILFSSSISLHFLLLPWVSSSLLRLCIIDFYATCVLFLIGNFLYSSNNVYDIHWPLIPLISSVYFYFYSNSSELPWKKCLLLTLLILLWSSHLIWQTVTSSSDIKHEDWRYHMMRGQFGNNFILFAFFVLHIIPMIEVLIGSSSIYYIFNDTNTHEQFTIGSSLSLGVIAVGVLLENIADRQLARFRSAYGSRASHAPWWCAIGPLLITLMMIFGSIPISEERLYRKYPEYKFVQRRIPILIPTFGLFR